MGFLYLRAAKISKPRPQLAKPLPATLAIARRKTFQVMQVKRSRLYGLYLGLESLG